MSAWCMKESQEKEECRLEHVTSCFIHVADACDIDVIADGHECYKIAVVGQGIELISLSLH